MTGAPDKTRKLYDQSCTNTDDGSETPVAHRPYNVAFARALIALLCLCCLCYAVFNVDHGLNIAHNVVDSAHNVDNNVAKKKGKQVIWNQQSAT